MERFSGPAITIVSSGFVTRMSLVRVLVRRLDVRHTYVSLSPEQMSMSSLRLLAYNSQLQSKGWNISYDIANRIYF
eukprot:scaffold321106_cov24-Prasinocladus_malaysianus.AAC.1